MNKNKPADSTETPSKATFIRRRIGATVVAAAIAINLPVAVRHTEHVVGDAASTTGDAAAMVADLPKQAVNSFVNRYVMPPFNAQENMNNGIRSTDQSNYDSRQVGFPEHVDPQVAKNFADQASAAANGARNDPSLQP